MKGIIFTLVEDAVVAEHGEDAWDQILADAGVSGVYTALGNYPSGELVDVVSAGARALDVDPEDLLRHLGRPAVSRLFERYPHFVAPHTTTRGFLLTLNDVIHPEVRKIHAGANPPEFWFDEDVPGDDGVDRLRVHYQSARQLCALATGMIEGAAAHFGEEARLVHRQCMHDGADHCVLDTTFSAAGQPER